MRLLVLHDFHFSAPMCAGIGALFGERGVVYGPHSFLLLDAIFALPFLFAFWQLLSDDELRPRSPSPER